MLRRLICASVLCIAAGTTLTAGSAGLASAASHPSTLVGQHGVKRLVPSTVKTLYSIKAQKQYAGTSVKEGIALATQPRIGDIPAQDFNCDFRVEQKVQVGTSTATAFLYGCTNVATCTQQARLQRESPGGVFVTVATGPVKTGCASKTSTAKVTCTKSANYIVYRGEGTFTFTSIFGDVVGPFSEPTGAGSFKVSC